MKIEVKFTTIGCPSNEELKDLARRVFKELPMMRAFDDDYEMLIQVFKDIHNDGRYRGIYETFEGPRC